ncbi:unnamed protein product [Moneuplotes crassus]|uniref:Uncharacterized protein n=1 Tax=Euplotes crassus TaxID=5936 RepID=A0AAD1XR95_EUPCR|nr:unnamed protein product [Moneuplotes crassus]
MLKYFIFLLLLLVSKAEEEVDCTKTCDFCCIQGECRAKSECIDGVTYLLGFCLLITLLLGAAIVFLCHLKYKNKNKNLSKYAMKLGVYKKTDGKNNKTSKARGKVLPLSINKVENLQNHPNFRRKISRANKKNKSYTSVEALVLPSVHRRYQKRFPNIKNISYESCRLLFGKSELNYSVNHDSYKQCESEEAVFIEDLHDVDDKQMSIDSSKQLFQQSVINSSKDDFRNTKDNSRAGTFMVDNFTNKPIPGLQKGNMIKILNFKDNKPLRHPLRISRNQ